MNLRQLRFFVTVVDEQGFKQAGRRLKTVPPTITLHVQKLEDELGVQLLDRNVRPIRPTAVGERFLVEARVVLAAADRALAVGRRTAPPPRTELQVGTMTGMGDRLEVVIESVARRRPGLRIDVQGVPAPARLDMVRDGLLDAAFVRFAGDAPGLILMPAWREPLRVAVAADSPLAGRAGEGGLGLDELAGLPLRLVARERNPALHDLVLRVLREAGVSPQLGAPVTDLAEALTGLGRDGAWTVVYEVPPVVEAPVRYLPFRPEVTIPVRLAVRARDEYAWLLLEGCRAVVEQRLATEPD